MKNIRIKAGKYRGWQCYFYPFRKPRWIATCRGETFLSKTNMGLLELIDFRTGEGWEA